MPIKLFLEGNKVVIDLMGRRTEVMLACAAAEETANWLEAIAFAAEREPPEPLRGEEWNIKVESYDGRVALRISGPFVGAPDRVRVPAEAARRLAAEIRDKLSWAKHKAKLVITARR